MGWDYRKSGSWPPTLRSRCVLQSPLFPTLTYKYNTEVLEQLLKVTLQIWEKNYKKLEGREKNEIKIWPLKVCNTHEG